MAALLLLQMGHSSSLYLCSRSTCANDPKRGLVLSSVAIFCLFRACNLFTSSCYFGSRQFCRREKGTAQGAVNCVMFVVHAALISELTPPEDDVSYHRTPSEDRKSVTWCGTPAPLAAPP